MKVAELSGSILSYWVARALGAPADELLFPRDKQGKRILWRTESLKCWEPRYATDWAQCGPLIEKFDMDIFQAGGNWYASTRGNRDAPGCSLILQEAICRAVVRAKFGDEVPEVAQ